MEEKMIFGEQVRRLRKEKKMTQKELAERLGLSVRTVVSYENGKSYPKSREIYDKLAEIFGISVNTLFLEEEPKEDIYTNDEVQQLIQRVGAMFSGGSLSEQDKDAVMRAIQDAYWDARREEK